jgi:hypothetical protein
MDEQQDREMFERTFALRAFEAASQQGVLDGVQVAYPGETPDAAWMPDDRTIVDLER